MAKKEIWYVYFGPGGDEEISSAIIEATEEQADDIRDYLLAASKSYPDALRELGVSRITDMPIEAKWIWESLHEDFPNVKDAPRPRSRWRT